MVDVCGEKLSDGFVTAVLAALVPAAPFALLAPDGGGYALFLEGPPPSELQRRVEHALCANPHYRHCRNLGQLPPVAVVQVAAGAYERFARHLVNHGTPPRRHQTRRPERPNGLAAGTMRRRRLMPASSAASGADVDG